MQRLPFLKSKCLFEAGEEVCKEKLVEDLVLNLMRQLSQNALIHLILKRIILVKSPFMFEKYFNFLRNLWINGVSIVVFDQEVEEFSEIFFIVIVLAKNLYLIHDVHEIVQDHGKGGNAT